MLFRIPKLALKWYNKKVSLFLLNPNCFKETIMPIRFGPTELILIIVIIVLLFGVGRIGKIAGELGSGIRSFRKGLQDDSDQADKDKTNPPDTQG
jgi:sec-independent protein translocase protein TatA